MKVKLIFLFAWLSLFLVHCARDPEALIDDRIARVEHGLLSDYSDLPWKRMDLLDRMRYYHVPGVSIAVINDFQIEWAKGYGVLEAGKNEPVTSDTLFQVASPGKVVVAVAALHTVGQGALDLDGDVNQHLVSWSIPDNEFTAEEKVTLRRLLSHSAGVTVEGFRGYALGEEVPNLQQILNGEWPANSPPILVDILPGTQHRYSGGGYMIVQQLLEDVTGETFPIIMQETVLEPWGMAASTFESPLPEHFRELAASGHRSDGSVIPGGWHTYPEMGSGASMWSTPSDLAKFAINVMRSYEGQSDGVLSHAMAIQMLTPQIDDRGLGPLVYDEGDGLYFFHPGANDGYKSVMAAYPAKGQGVVIMTNSDNGEALWREILNSVSVEYGLVSGYPFVYVIIIITMVVILAGILLLRKLKTRDRSGR